MKLLVVSLKTLVFLLLFFTSRKALCEVTLELVRKVALIDTYATFSCSGVGSAHLKIKNDGTDFDKTIDWGSTPIIYSEDQINVTRTEETVDGKKIRTFDISIFANTTNNNTQMTCTFAQSDVVSTGPVYLTIAKDELGEDDGFRNPTFEINKSAITIKWLPPWSHPVNGYKVTVNNETDNKWTDYDVEEGKTEWIMNAEDSTTYAVDCHNLKIFMTALTDVGDTMTSIVTTGFPMELEEIDQSNITVSVLRRKSGSLRVEVSFKAPKHCSKYQQISYQYVLHDNNHPHDFEEYGPFFEPGLEFEGFVELKGNYRFEITYWDIHSPSNKLEVTKYFYTNFSTNNDVITSCETTSCQPFYVTRTQASCSPTVDTGTASTVLHRNGTNSLVYIIGAIGGAVCFLLFVCIIVLILIIVKTRRRVPKATRDVCEIEPTPIMGKPQANTKSNSTKQCNGGAIMRKQSIPQMMATNPLYEGNETLYAFVPDAKNLKTVNETEQQLPSNITSTSMNIPPQLPPPRKMSLDSPGIKSGVQLSLSKRYLEYDESTDCNDQYIPMRSASELRYTKSPFMKIEESTSCNGKSGFVKNSELNSSGSTALNNNEENNMEKI